MFLQSPQEKWWQQIALWGEFWLIKVSRGKITRQNSSSKIKIYFCIWTVYRFIKNNNVLILSEAFISTNYKSLKFSYFKQQTSSAKLWSAYF